MNNRNKPNDCSLYRLLLAYKHENSEKLQVELYFYY